MQKRTKAKWQHKELQQIQPTSWNKHHGRAITNTNRGRATTKQDSCGHTKITIYNGNSQADSNLEHPKLRQRISRQTYWKPFTMAKPNNIRDQHPDEELWQITATQTATKTNNFNHDTHREDAKTRDHQDKNVSRRPHSGTKHTQMWDEKEEVITSTTEEHRNRVYEAEWQSEAWATEEHRNRVKQDKHPSLSLDNGGTQESRLQRRATMEKER